MYIFVLVNLFAAALGQIQLEGICNLVSAIPESALEINRMLGTWHQIKRIANTYENGECSTLNIKEQIDANGMVEKYIFSRTEKNSTSSSEVSGDILAGSVNGLYEFNFTEGYSLIFVIQSTDYTGHAIIYSCYNSADQTKLVMAWQYNRKASLTEAEQAEVDRFVVTNPDLANVTWHITNQSSAFCNSGISLSLSSVFYFALVGVVTYMFKGVSY